MQSAPLWLLRPYPRPNARKVFKADRPICALCLTDKLFCNAVVFALSKVALTAGEAFKDTLSRLRTLALKASALTTATVAHPVEFCASVVRPVRVRKDVDNKYTLNIVRRGVVYPNQSKVTFALLGLQKLPLTLAAGKGDVGSPSTVQIETTPLSIL